MPNPIRCVRQTQQGDMMGNLKLPSTKDTSEAPLAPFTAVEGQPVAYITPLR